MGHSLRGTHAHCKGNLVPSKSKLHINYLELKEVFWPLEFQDLCLNNIAVVATDNTMVTVYIKKEGDEFGPSLCPTMENPDLVLQETGNSADTFHAAECHSRQAVQARPNHQDRMLPPVRGLPCNILLVAPAPSGPVFATWLNNKLPQLVSPVPDPQYGEWMH